MTLRAIIRTLTICAVTLPASLALAQQRGDDARPSQAREKSSGTAARQLQAEFGHVEVPDDSYVPVPREGRRVTPGVQWTRGGYTSVQVNVDGNGNNIVGDAGNEPSIALDVTNPLRMAIGWRQFDTVTNNFRQAGYAYTNDGGQTWTFPGLIDPGVFRSDPVLDSDAQGNFFYNSLTAVGADYWCRVYKSTDGGMTWDAGSYAEGGDKQWMVIDRTNGIGQNNIYAFWTRLWSICQPGHFTRSYDGGQTFLPCTTIPGTPKWGTLAVGPDGELYAAGDGFVVARSSTMQDELLPAAWDFSTNVSLDGSMVFSTGPNPAGLLGQAWIAVDHSTGPTRGNVYLACSVSRFSTPDPLDVMFAGSTDGGQTWSDPVRINDDAGTSAHQWFGTMSVAPDGRIDVVWLDTRDDPGGYDSVLYHAFSEDAGATWFPNEPLGPSFDPHVGWPNQSKMGDYFHMVSDTFGAHLAYAATYNGEQDVYYIYIPKRPTPPIAQGIEVSTAVSTMGTFTLEATDEGQPEPAAMEFIITSLPAQGDLSDPGNGPIAAVPHTLVNNGEQVEYTPDLDYYGPDSFEFKANDGGVPPEGGDSNIAVASVTVGGPDWDPVAYETNASTILNTPTDITLLASDPNSDPLTYIIETLPAAGSLHDPGAGPIVAAPYTLVGGGNVVTYTPPPDQHPQETFHFSVRDATAVSRTATVTVDISAAQAVYSFLMDASPGWATSGQWAFGQPTGGGSYNGDPTSGHTGNNVYGYNLGGDYENGMLLQYLTSDPIDCTYVVNSELQFWRWLGVESSFFDHANLQISTDGLMWSSLWDHTGGTVDESSWSFHTFDISSIADGESTVFFRWGMGPTDATNAYAGWNLDDVVIWGIDTTPVPSQCDQLTYTPGDMNLDGSVSGADVQTLVQMLLNPAGAWTAEQLCAADFSGDEVVSLADVDAFVQELLDTTPVPSQCDLLTYTPGDVNLDGSVNGADVQTLVQMLLNPSGEWTAEQLCAADFSGDEVVSLADVDAFVQELLDTAPVPSQCEQLTYTPGDVNLDGSVNGLDVQTLVQMLLNPAGAWTAEQLCAADFSGDELVSLADVDAFVQELLN